MNTATPGPPASQVVYIAGYGRSGSTLLDMILGWHEAVVGTSELSFVFDQVLRGGACTCGEPLLACPLWGPVLERVGKAGFTWKQAADITRRAERLFSRHRDPTAYRRLWEELMAALREQSGTSVVVDSSKSTRLTVRRARMLGEYSLDSLKVIHLVKDPANVMQAVHRGYNRTLAAGVEGNTRRAVLRGFLGWIVANLLVECTWRRRDGRRLLVRYEDLVGDPPATLRTIGGFIGCDLSAVASQVQSGESIPAGHAIKGNRMRRGTAVALQAPRTTEEPTPAYIRMLTAVVWPMRRRYGYG